MTSNGTDAAAKPTNGSSKKSSSSSPADADDDDDFGPNVQISRHPILSHKISILRSSSTSPASFRSVLRDITFHLGYEATSTLATKPTPLSVPVGRHDHVHITGERIADRVALVPILRSGLGMVDSMLELLPDAGVHHIGMYRQGLVPVQYYNRLPKKCESDVAYVLDPVVATGSTIMSVCSQLKKWGVEKIHVVAVIASKKGLQKLLKTHPDIYISVGTVDDELTEDGAVIPGLGDAGDRLFGTPLIDDEEQLLHPSKRRRTMSDA